MTNRSLTRSCRYNGIDRLRKYGITANRARHHCHNYGYWYRNLHPAEGLWLIDGNGSQHQWVATPIYHTSSHWPEMLREQFYDGNGTTSSNFGFHFDYFINFDLNEYYLFLFEINFCWKYELIKIRIWVFGANHQVFCHLLLITLFQLSVKTEDQVCYKLINNDNKILFMY